MEFRTPLAIEKMEHLAVYGDKMLFLGSCFADEIGRRCREMGFDALVNPFGVLFNPASIAQSIKRMQKGEAFVESEVIEVGGEFYTTFWHNSSFWCSTPSSLLQKANQSLGEAAIHFQKAKWIFISLGTSWVYRDKATQSIVSNCHKLPATRFEKTFLSVDESFQCLSDIVVANPEKHFVFTVSPLRHIKDGLHGNELSKAALLLALDRLCKQYENADYFPAYEIMMDELRDYRFYKEDMIHPTEQAIQYIWEKFVSFGIAKSEYEAMKMAHEVKEMLHHKAFFPDSRAYRQFEQARDQKIASLRTRFPQVRIDLLEG